jgi:hypothetical protein
MKNRLTLRLSVTPEQGLLLGELQRLFAEVCNVISDMAVESRCFNRVALHHLSYAHIRKAYPQLGSQMVCNAIYAVAKVTKMLFLNKGSPVYKRVKESGDYPRCQFQKNSPVFFDKNTLSIKDSRLCLYTMVGRLVINAQLAPEVVKRISGERVSELILKSNPDGFSLLFIFEGKEDEAEVTSYVEVRGANSNAILEAA